MSKIAFVFPGQGSQQVGMLQLLADQYPEINETLTEASDALSLDLRKLIFTGPADVLNQTENTQPALLASSVAIWRVWQSLGGTKPVFMAGHSLGEYSALVCAKSISLVDAVRLVRRRGQLMQAAVPDGQGAMAAVLGLDDNIVQQACDQVAEAGLVSPVNYNSPGQVVIAGQAAAVDKAISEAEALGAKKVVKLSVSVPSHCELMKPAAEQLADVLSSIDIAVPEISVVQNVSGRIAETPEVIRTQLIEQLYSPVQWVATVNTMLAAEVDTIIECGPGKVLSGLNKRIQRKLQVSSLETPELMSKMISSTSVAV
ncbi:ACP S-malonyltransferase [Zooshikella ganghwensis]|uniref:Malonyl CoA-acyl carrier protein transacylase n=1 Tax=Zooshikella ganghwensis TaxID=202772 RepID=A0A4V1INN3_9GAMM|nr:ACP S-malonyltransferase [Zooshikella ganghwensis]RDH44331.1 [acyl-carrier-protein] S-malonyltransferase [Zooshikella ganghwensis]